MWRAPLGRVQFLCTSGFRSSRFGPIVPLRRADKLGVLEAVRERVACADARDLKQPSFSKAIISRPESSRGGFILLQETRKISRLQKHRGLVTAALHGCQPTPLL